MNLITAFKVDVKVVPNYVTENGGKSVLENVTESTDGNYLQLTERQRNIIDRLIETGKLRVSDNVLENALETSASLAKHLSVSERTIRLDSFCTNAYCIYCNIVYCINVFPKQALHLHFPAPKFLHPQGVRSASPWRHLRHFGWCEWEESKAPRGWAREAGNGKEEEERTCLADRGTEEKEMPKSYLGAMDKVCDRVRGCCSS